MSKQSCKAGSQRYDAELAELGHLITNKVSKAVHTKKHQCRASELERHPDSSDDVLVLLGEGDKRVDVGVGAPASTLR